MLELYYLKEADSVCSNRAVITLIEKGIDEWTPHYIKLLNEDHFEDSYLSINPKAVVPTLVHNGMPIRESSIICDYIDELIPERPLKPENIVDRAYLREWIKESDEVGFPGIAALNFVTRFRSVIPIDILERRWKKQPDLEKTLRQQSVIREGMASEWVLRGLVGWDKIFQKMEDTLSDGRPWIMGENLTLVETCYAPLIKVLDMIKWLDIWFTDRPNVRQWWDSLGNRPSVLELDEYEGHTADLSSDHAKAGLLLRDEARDRLIDYNNSRV
ncbi:MAG: glutathione S-transferase family protein [Rhodospirillales bacterium]|nr:glutathione S-transferase family protein [Rhodospirillales bacterium]